jgi:hypothetical protein
LVLFFHVLADEADACAMELCTPGLRDGHASGCSAEDGASF